MINKFFSFLTPVGALTSKPYAFSARPWELDQVESIDFFDSVGSSIRLDTRGGSVMRVLPRVNEAVNEEWISDKIRFSYDGFRRQRLDRPLTKVGGEVGFSDKTTSSANYRSISWEGALNLIKSFSCGTGEEQQQYTPIRFVFGRMTDLQTLAVVKELLIFYADRSPASGLVWNSPIEFLDSRSNYLSPPFSQISSSNLLLLVGINSRIDLPVLNLRLRRLRSLPVFLFGSSSLGGSSSREVNLGGAVSTLVKIAEGKHPLCRSLTAQSTILVGEGVAGSVDSSSILRLLSAISYYSSAKLGFLHSFSSTVGASELGMPDFSYDEGRQKPILWILDNDEIEFDKSNFSLVVYQGHHGDRMVSKADLILPSPLPIEKRSILLNYEGRYHRLDRPISSPPREALPEWEVLFAFFKLLNPKAERIDDFERWIKRGYGGFYTGNHLSLPSSIFIPSKLENGVIQPPVSNFYLNDSISRASSNMAVASARLHRPSDNFKQF